nr:MAG TPA_asm: hypothetical protein [Caudoviricetes sp.]DAU43749.1 MAG TPA: hypothetical protein [Caudoviricetes sp.]
MLRLKASYINGLNYIFYQSNNVTKIYFTCAYITYIHYYSLYIIYNYNYYYIIIYKGAISGIAMRFLSVTRFFLVLLR